MDEPTTAADVLAILDGLDVAGVDWWIGGGWGIDALVGEETRPHSDLDLCIRAEQEALASAALEGCGLRLQVDERPTRFLMAAPGHGAVDVHPLHFAADGTARLQGPDGIEFAFAVGSLDGIGTIGGKSVHCFTSERQRVAHSGYEPRERDLRDLALLDRLADIAAGRHRMDRPLLRATFEQVPLLYDRARPKYPEQVFDELLALARLPEAARIVEIGCGTGQATLPLAERGHRVTCVELGEQLAAAARGKLARFPAVEVINADFEAWQPARAEFDAVVAFTSFHWIDPEMRYAKAASLLRKGGMLGIVGTEHVLPPDGDDFFRQVQADYETVLPDDPATHAGAPRPPDAIPDLSQEISASGLFRSVATRRFLWNVAYSADEYIDVLNTYSNHRALDHDTRERLLTRIHRRVRERPGGQVRKTYLAVLDVAERLRAY